VRNDVQVEDSGDL